MGSCIVCTHLHNDLIDDVMMVSIGECEDCTFARPFSRCALIFRLGGYGPAEILAKGAQPQGSHVSKRAGGDTGCDGACGVHQGHAASVHPDSALYLKYTLPGWLFGWPRV